MQYGDRSYRLEKPRSAPAVVAENTPVFESGNRMLDACPPPTMSSPASVSRDAATTKPGRNELGNSAVRAVRKHTSVKPREPLDLASTVVNRIVAIPGAAAADRDHAEVRTADQNLYVARPAVVLGLGRDGVIARWHKGPVDDPAATTVQVPGRREHERGDAVHDVGDDAVSLRSRDAKHGGELAHGEVRTEARTRDNDPLLERACPGAAAPYLVRT